MEKEKVFDPIHIEWRITERCNYRCSYCFQENKSYRDCDETVTAKALDLLKTFPKCKIKLCGGEPFCHADFFGIVETLMSCSHDITITTNFSFPVETILKFVEISKGHLAYMTASLHLEEVKSLEEFVDKAKVVNDALDSKSGFGVTSVLTAENFDTLRSVERGLTERGVAFKYQRIRRDGKYCEYPKNIEEYISTKFISGLNEIYNFRSFGRECRAGMDFFRILLNGDCYSCFNAQPGFYMGNIADGTFSRLERPRICLSRRCTCTVPIGLGLIDMDKRHPIKGVASYIKEVAPLCLQIVREKLGK